MIDPDVAVVDLPEDFLHLFYTEEWFFQVVPVNRTINFHGIAESLGRDTHGMVLCYRVRVGYPGLIREECFQSLFYAECCDRWYPEWSRSLPGCPDFLSHC